MVKKYSSMITKYYMDLIKEFNQYRISSKDEIESLLKQQKRDKGIINRSEQQL